MSGLQTGRRGPGRPAKGGHRHSVRFMHDDVYNRALNTWERLGFESFSHYVDFTFALAHGKWKELGFDSAEEGAEYLRGLGQGSLVKPPHLRDHDDSTQEVLPLNEEDSVAA